MKEITIEIKVLIPNNYTHCDDAGWIMDDLFDLSSSVIWKRAIIKEE